MPFPLVTSIGISEDIIALYKKINEEWLRRSPGYVMRVRAFFMTILQRYMAMLVYEVDTYRLDPRVKNAIRYITDHYAKPMQITDVARAVSLNPVYFGALFKKETQMAFRDYLNMIRLNQAEDMLRTGEWNVTEVALRCRFGDVFYFSRLYKKHKGVPPSRMLG
jgi:YesN/AraC family two-component response regulator